MRFEIGCARTLLDQSPKVLPKPTGSDTQAPSIQQRALNQMLQGRRRIPHRLAKRGERAAGLGGVGHQARRGLKRGDGPQRCVVAWHRHSETGGRLFASEKPSAPGRRYKQHRTWPPSVSAPSSSAARSTVATHGLDQLQQVSSASAEASAGAPALGSNRSAMAGGARGRTVRRLRHPPTRSWLRL